MVQYSLGVGIEIYIEVRVRLAITGEKRSQTQRVARMAGSDQYGVADRIFNEMHTAKHERAQEHLPEHGIGLHDPPQIGAVDFKQRARFASTAQDQTAAAREQVHLAGEFTSLDHGENSFNSVQYTDDFNAAAEDDEDAMFRTPLVEHRLARSYVARHTERRELRDLGIIQLGEQQGVLFGRFWLRYLHIFYDTTLDVH
jgi:hypothetical protein